MNRVAEESGAPAEYTNGLDRALRPVDAVMIVVGNVVGVGIFTTTGFIAADIPDARYIMAAWLLGGFLTLFGALSYGELGAIFPRAGGDYVYLREAYGPWAGFLVGWVGFFIINPGSIAALALGFSKYLLPVLAPETEFSPLASKLVALSSVLVFSGLNYRSVRWSSRAQNIVSGLNLVIIILIVSTGFIWGSGNLEHFKFSSNTVSAGDLFGPAMISVFFTYSGWFVSAYVASEMKTPQKTLPLSLVYSSVIIAALYLFMNALYIYALPVPEMQGVVDVARRASEALMGSRFAFLFSIMIVFAILGSLNSVILTAPRIYYAMAQDGVFLKTMGNAHPRYKTPYVAIVLQAAISCVLIIAGNFYQLLSYVVFIMLLSSIATAAGVFVLRARRPELRRPYKVWGYPFTTAAFIIAYSWIAYKIMLGSPRNAGIGVLIALSGIPFYLYWKNQKRRVRK